MSGLRATDAARLTLGVVALARPSVASSLTHTPETPAVRRTVRILGLRYVVQGVAGAVADDPLVSRLNVTVEGAHALSMLALAGVDRRHRTLALASAALATTFAAADRRHTRSKGSLL